MSLSCGVWGRAYVRFGGGRGKYIGFHLARSGSSFLPATDTFTPLHVRVSLLAMSRPTICSAQPPRQHTLWPWRISRLRKLPCPKSLCKGLHKNNYTKYFMLWTKTRRHRGDWEAARLIKRVNMEIDVLVTKWWFTKERSGGTHCTKQQTRSCPRCPEQTLQSRRGQLLLFEYLIFFSIFKVCGNIVLIHRKKE